MSSEHAHPQHGEEKKHGDAMERAIQEVMEHESNDSSAPSAIPPAENGSHARSAAAHLEETEHLHKNGLQGGHGHVPMTQVNALRQPPQDIHRVGKQNRGK